MLRLYRYLRERGKSIQENNNYEHPQVQEQPHQNLITFDVSLPGQHRYLGNDLELVSDGASSDLSGVLEEGSTVELPCLVACDMGVVVPGQLVPVSLHHPADVALMSGLTQRQSHDEAAKFVAVIAQPFSYGCTVRIASFKAETDNRSGITIVKAKLLGCQRIELLRRREEDTRSIPRSGGHFRTVRVRVLTEAPVAPHSLSSAASRLPFRLQAALCPFPAWLLKDTQPSGAAQLAAEVSAELSRWCPAAAKPAAPPSDSPGGGGGMAPLSYWLMRQLPLPDWLRAALLACDHPARRLRRCLAAMRRCIGFACGGCGQLLIDSACCDLLCLNSSSGCTGAYVNPAGEVHELVTTGRLARIRVSPLSSGSHPLRCRGSRSSEHSWFPGYEWRVAECRRCGRHVGWRFTRVRGCRHLEPIKFWGLRRAVLVPCWTAAVSEGGEDWDPMVTRPCETVSEEE